MRRRASCQIPAAAAVSTAMRAPSWMPTVVVLRLEHVPQCCDPVFGQRAFPRRLAGDEMPALQELQLPVGCALAHAELFGQHRGTGGAQFGNEEQHLFLPRGQGWSVRSSARSLFRRSGPDTQGHDCSPAEVILERDGPAEEGQLFAGHRKAGAHPLDEPAHRWGGRGEARFQCERFVYDPRSMVGDADGIAIVQNTNDGPLEERVDEILNNLPDDDERDAPATLACETVRTCGQVADELVKLLAV